MQKHPQSTAATPWQISGTSFPQATLALACYTTTPGGRQDGTDDKQVQLVVSPWDSEEANLQALALKQAPVVGDGAPGRQVVGFADPVQQRLLLCLQG